MIELWPQSGVASLADLARALELTEANLGELWPTLPRDDQWIAAQLGVTRRQVINLRKCARKRLARRLKSSSRRRNEKGRADGNMTRVLRLHG